ncbi:MAG: hypothetical protein U0350_17805 [Caldilineaceae bacterium]
MLTVELEAEREKIAAETPFFYCAKYNQLEFKGRRDRLTETDYHTIDGRKHFLLSEHKFSPFEFTVTIICAGKPHAVFSYAQQLQQPFQAVAEGYYKREGIPPVYLIISNELPILPKNYPLLLFAGSDRKFREFLDQLIVTRNRTYIRYAYEVRPKVTKEALTMAGISATLSREDLKFMAEDIGPELIAFLKPKELLQAMSTQKRRELMAVIAEDTGSELAALLKPEDLLQGMSPEKRRELMMVMAKDTGSELAALLEPEDLLQGIDPKKQQALLANMSVEELLNGMTPEQQKTLFALVLKMLASGLTEQA